MLALPAGRPHNVVSVAELTGFREEIVTMPIELSKYYTDTLVCPHCREKAVHNVIANGPLDRSTMKRVRGGTLIKFYKALECQLCRSVTLSITTQRDPGGMMGDPETVRIEYFPPLPIRALPKWTSDLDRKTASLLREIYGALENSLPVVASSGIRTVLDRLAVAAVGDVGTFRDKLAAMEKKGLLDSDERQIMSAVIDAGSASAHRGFSPDKETVIAMLDIAEELLAKIEVGPKRKARLARKAKAITAKVPPRPRA
jgi:hypothetical protein